MIDLVGHFGSHLSYATVADQLAQGLDDCDALGNIINLDDKCIGARWSNRVRRERGKKVIVVADAPYLMESLCSEYAQRDTSLFVCPNTNLMSEDRVEMCRSAGRIYTPSRWCSGAIVHGLEETDEIEVCVMPLGIDDPFATEQRGPRDDHHKVRLLHLTTDTFWPGRKGTEELIEAWSIVRSMMSESHQHMSLTIHCLPGLYQTIYQTLGDAKLVGEIEVLPANGRGGDSRGLFDLIAQHDMLVAPSRSEGFGIMPLSALASGTPVVTTTGTGQDEYLSDMNGWLATPTMGQEELFGEHGLAPVVDVERLALQLVAGMHLQHELTSAAALNDTRQAEWSWQVRRETWAQSLINWEKEA